ncbi:MAG: hypothetical protein EPN30_06505 [Actinomycetota bacterium]|nr:MAG: hypothetical protein EPN30_06505 [Actinomycetota bacterium]
MTDQKEEIPRNVPPLMVATWESATSDPDPLAALGATRALMALLSTWEAKLAVEAVAGGATWEAIGSSLGVSRQAAWEHLHDHVEEFRDHIKSEARALRDRHRQEMQEFREEVRRKARDYHKFR